MASFSAFSVTNAGKQFISQLIKETVSVDDYRIKWGSDGTAPALTQTDVLGYVTDSVAATATVVTTTVTNDTLRLTARITAAGTVTIRECACFVVTPSSTVMLARGTFSAQTLNSGDYIDFTFNIVISS